MRKNSLIGSCPECNNGLLSCFRYNGAGATRITYCPTCGWESDKESIINNNISQFKSKINTISGSNNI